MDGNVIQAVVVAAVPAAVLWRGMRRIGSADLTRWSTRFGVVVAPESRTLVVATLQRGRRIRAVGATAGTVVAALPAFVNLIAPERSSDFAGAVNGLAWVYGAALGTALAEILVVQRPRERRAALEVRRWTDYVPTAPVTLTGAASLAGVAAAAVAVARDTDKAAEAMAAAIAGLIAAACLVAGLRKIVDRARLVMVGPERDLDEAMRADGAHRLAGAAIAMAGTSAAIATTEALWDLLPPMALLLVVLQYGALSWWWSLSRTTPWRIMERRPADA